MNPLQFLPEHASSSISGCLRTRDPRLVWERLCYMVTRRFTPFTTKQGYRIDHVQQLISWWELAHEQRIFNGWSHLIDGHSTILDIGANFGIFGYMCRRKWPECRLIGIEPHPDLAKYLALLRDDRPQWCNYVYDHSIQAAAFNASGYTTLKMSDCGFTGSTNPCYPTNNSFSVKCFRLDDDWFKCDFIKVDVDGAELDVLEGGVETFRKCKGFVMEIVDPKRVPKVSAITGKPMRQQVTSIDYVFY